jgi:hypothetical protein
MIKDSNNQHYINNCGQGELLSCKPEDYYYSKYRGDSESTKCLAEMALYKLTQKEIKRRGYKLVRFEVNVVEVEVIDYED